MASGPHRMAMCSHFFFFFFEKVRKRACAGEEGQRKRRRENREGSMLGTELEVGFDLTT